MPTWRQTAAVIAKPNAQKHAMFLKTYALCLAGKYTVILVGTLPSNRPSSPLGNLSLQLG